MLKYTGVTLKNPTENPTEISAEMKNIGNNIAVYPILGLFPYIRRRIYW